MAKETITKMKREPIILENIFANDTSDKGLISKIYKKNSYNSTPGRQTVQLKNGKEVSLDNFPKIQRAHRYMKRCSTSQAIRDANLNHNEISPTPVRMAIINRVNF